MSRDTRGWSAHQSLPIHPSCLSPFGLATQGPHLADLLLFGPVGPPSLGQPMPQSRIGQWVSPPFCPHPPAADLPPIQRAPRSWSSPGGNPGTVPGASSLAWVSLGWPSMAWWGPSRRVAPRVGVPPVGDLVPHWSGWALMLWGPVPSRGWEASLASLMFLTWGRLKSEDLPAWSPGMRAFPMVPLSPRSNGWLLLLGTIPGFPGPLP
ncbi:hypothetical protein GE061_017214 [Apolygus lucorum]|uniref:Uncharacterized protein n=1 Tax=Apolygus lucorum TaxID=248454 RepID=A0A8S9XA80_APOLU|nr:hypothetical protein GE061_017214 [Apolygus lucorum]